MVGAGGRWIIFCHFHTEMDMLKELLKPIVEKVQIYSGALNAAEKEAVLTATHGVNSEVLLVQLQSGGVGLNLQHFDKILFTGPWWTKALMDQAIGRAVRIGQREVVQVYSIVLKEENSLNIDTYITGKASEKGSLCGKVLAAATNSV
jgi:SNF2 family DNA or RNA helicase